MHHSKIDLKTTWVDALNKEFTVKRLPSDTSSGRYSIRVEINRIVYQTRQYRTRKDLNIKPGTVLHIHKGVDKDQIKETLYVQRVFIQRPRRACHPIDKAILVCSTPSTHTI